MLVLLPGLHGSGELFQPLLSELVMPSRVIELPRGENQSREFLAEEISKQLPAERSILLVESFSGCLVPEIIKISPGKIAGVIFVASFISSPNQILLGLAGLVPSSVMQNAVLLSIVLKMFFLNGNSDQKLLDCCVQAVLDLPQAVIKARLETMYQMVRPDQVFATTVVYIRAEKDRVVGIRHYKEIEARFKASQITVNGPHFLLQAAPTESALAVQSAIEKISALNPRRPISHTEE